MKKHQAFRWILTVFAAVLLLCALPGTVLAEETCTTDDGKWSFSACGEGVQITAYHGTAADVFVPAKVTFEGENYAVLKLSDSLFHNNDSLNSVTLGEGITEIGARAFYDCDNLVCIVTNETLTTIGAEAFYSCDSFNSVILYDAVAAIGENAFAECPKVTIWCNESSAAYFYIIKNILRHKIMNHSEIPLTFVQDGVKYYISNGQACVMHVTQQQRVVIPASVNNFPVTAINENALNDYYRGERFIPDSITVIPENLSIQRKLVVHCGEDSAFHRFASGHNIPV